MIMMIVIIIIIRVVIIDWNSKNTMYKMHHKKIILI